MDELCRNQWHRRNIDHTSQQDWHKNEFIVKSTTECNHNEEKWVISNQYHNYAYRPLEKPELNEH